MSKWEWKKLGEVAKIYNGNSINANVKKERYSNVESGFPFIATKDVGNDSEVDYENGIRIPFEEAGFKVARKDTVLICAEGGSAGKKKCILNEDVCFGNKLFAIDYNREKLIGKFVFYYTFEQSFTDEFQKLLSGIIGGVSSAKFKEIQIPIPPLSEQKRIVKFLDEEISKIDTLKTNAETNLKNAKELFETTLEKELNPPSRHSERSEESSAELPSGWEWKKMEDICEITSSKRVYQSEWQNKGIPFLRISDFVQLFENKKEIDAELFISPEKYNELKMNNQVPEAGDILITARGTLGTCYIVKPNDCFYFQDGMITWLKNISNNIHPSFITYLFKNSTFRRQIDKNQSGSTVAYLSISMLKKFVLPLPPLSVQKEIVARLDKLSENVKRLEANYKQIIANCDELKKSILKKTFEGDSRSSRE